MFYRIYTHGQFESARTHAINKNSSKRIKIFTDDMNKTVKILKDNKMNMDIRGRTKLEAYS